MAQMTIASLSVAIITRNAPTHCRPSSSTAGRPVSASASRNARAPPIGARTISCAYTAPFVPAFVSSSIVGLHRSGATIRSKPPERSSDATDHHSASDGSCAPCPTSSCSKFVGEAFPSVELPHVHGLRATRPVDPTVAHTPKQLMWRSAARTGHQFAVMWCM